jgi:uncharacterized integral membrane protein
MNKFINTVRAIIMFTLLLFILIFCFQNSQDVSIHFLNIHLQSLPLFIALFGTLATGLLIGFLGGMISGTKSKRDALTKSEAPKEVKQAPLSTEPEIND